MESAPCGIVILVETELEGRIEVEGGEDGILLLLLYVSLIL